MGLGGVAIAVPPYVIHPKTAVLGRAGGGDIGQKQLPTPSAMIMIWMSL